MAYVWILVVIWCGQLSGAPWGMLFASNSFVVIVIDVKSRWSELRRYREESDCDFSFHIFYTVTPHKWSLLYLLSESINSKSNVLSRGSWVGAQVMDSFVTDIIYIPNYFSLLLLLWICNQSSHPSSFDHKMCSIQMYPWRNKEEINCIHHDCFWNLVLYKKLNLQRSDHLDRGLSQYPDFSWIRL
jgi:hypothetical protein